MTLTDNERKQLTHIRQQVERLENTGINYPGLRIVVTVDDKEFWLRVLDEVLKAGEVEHPPVDLNRAKRLEDCPPMSELY